MMKWFVMVFFLSYHPDGTRDTFVFTTPTYDDEASCRATLLDREEIAMYVMGLMDAYNGMLPGAVEMLNCIDQNQFDKLQGLEDKKEDKVDA